MSEIPPSVLTSFLAHLSTDEPEKAQQYFDDIHTCLNTKEGINFVNLLEKAVLINPAPPGCSDRALRELNGMRLIVADFRRIARHGRK